MYDWLRKVLTREITRVETLISLCSLSIPPTGFSTAENVYAAVTIYWEATNLLLGAGREPSTDHDIT